ncbi:MAG TPA: DUF5715 family protein [Gemmatimonadaceae bacterium]|nr:DUF5715 family protein [Gemmatimonadaceae bacterium]
MTPPFRLSGSLAVAVMLASLAATRPCSAQSLRGSKASVNRMYRHARAEGLPFYETTRGVRAAAAAGTLVRLTPNADFSLHQVSFPYVRPATRTFVERLAVEYHAQCGKPMEVTSAVRPESRQPENSVARSVHPTGIAVDLHKPTTGACLRWLRGTLLSLEGDGTIEVTEEFNPPHFHVAVYPTPYKRYVAQLEGESRPAASAAATSVATYRVRTGDTLWDIARAHDTTVAAIRSLNHLESSVIQPGDKLLVPTGG